MIAETAINIDFLYPYFLFIKNTKLNINNGIPNIKSRILKINSIKIDLPACN